MDLIEQISRDEGRRSKPYTDTVGKLTVGVGRNLTDVGLSEDEIDYLLANDIKRAQDGLSSYPWYTALDPIRQAAITNLAFNLGIHGLLGFPHFLSAVAKQDWVTAASELANSVWARQVGARATRIEQQILSGTWQ